jgi:flagellar hook-basal body complex protein FliE
MRIDPTQMLALKGEHNTGPTDTLIKDVGKDFGNMLEEVNRLSQAADDKVEEFATSPDKDIHGTMIALEKAQISLRLLLQVRAKLTNAFQEIMRTPL